MLEREYIVERIKSLPDESLKEVTDFVEFLEAKRERLVEEREKEGREDPLSKVIGICEGPSDLAERHNKYIYQIKLERITEARFKGAWTLRKKYQDKPDISFTDLTSFVLMQELWINKVFTGDAHFEEINLGFEILPK